jgi:hypothetical protein
MTWSGRRKFIYILSSIALLLVVIGVPSFFAFKKVPSCFDNKQNQNEQGVDCGGECMRLCKASMLPVAINWQRPFKVSDSVYTATAYLNNPNNAEAFNVPYTFTLYDSNNEIITTREGTAYIPAKKNIALVETGIGVGEKIPLRTLFELKNDFDWFMVMRQQPELTHKYQRVPSILGETITATISNPAFDEVKQVRVTVIVYDTQGNAMASSKTVIMNLRGESEQAVSFTWPEKFTKSVGKIEVIPIAQ